MHGVDVLRQVFMIQTEQSIRQIAFIRIVLLYEDSWNEKRKKEAKGGVYRDNGFNLMKRFHVRTADFRIAYWFSLFIIYGKISIHLRTEWSGSRGGWRLEGWKTGFLVDMKSLDSSCLAEFSGRRLMSCIRMVVYILIKIFHVAHGILRGGLLIFSGWKWMSSSFSYLKFYTFVKYKIVFILCLHLYISQIYRHK